MLNFTKMQMAEAQPKSWAGRVALVTGAASGNGKATAKALAKHGMVLVGCDIDLDNLEVKLYLNE